MPRFTQYRQRRWCLCEKGMMKVHDDNMSIRAEGQNSAEKKSSLERQWKGEKER